MVFAQVIHIKSHIIDMDVFFSEPFETEMMNKKFIYRYSGPK